MVYVLLFMNYISPPPQRPIVEGYAGLDHNNVLGILMVDSPQESIYPVLWAQARPGGVHSFTARHVAIKPHGPIAYPPTARPRAFYAGKDIRTKHVLYLGGIHPAHRTVTGHRSGGQVEHPVGKPTTTTAMTTNEGDEGADTIVIDVFVGGGWRGRTRSPRVNFFVSAGPSLENRTTNQG